MGLPWLDYAKNARAFGCVRSKQLTSFLVVFGVFDFRHGDPLLENKKDRLMLEAGAHFTPYSNYFSNVAA
jgi:hypothetical protein